MSLFDSSSLGKDPFLLALRRWGRFARRNDVRPRETSPAVSPAAKSEEKRMLSQAKFHVVEETKEAKEAVMYFAQEF